jgi:hypothetical protein
MRYGGAEMVVDNDCSKRYGGAEIVVDIDV